MNKKLMATLTAMLLVGGIFVVSHSVRSDDDSSDDNRRGLRFSATLTGAQENPAVATQGKGHIDAHFDDGLTRVVVDLRVQDLSGEALRAHFHCQRPGLNGSIAFGLFDPGPCVSDGLRTRCTLRNENFTGADCVPAIGRPVNNIAALAFAMRDGLIYANVHTMMFPSGEIRGQMLER